MDNVFLNVSILLAIAAVVACAVRVFRQPIVVGYLLAGVLVGPFALDLLRDDAVVRTFADFGIVLLLFLIGLSLNIRHLRQIGKSAVFAGVGQFVFTAVVGFVILLALPLPMATRIALAIAITFSSTIIIGKLLSDRGDTERLYGRHVIGLMVVQDLIAIALLAVLGVMDPSAGSGSPFATIARVVLAGAGIVLAARFVLPRVLDAVAGSTEHLFLTTVAWSFGVAAAVHAIGLSLELGAVAAGVSLASSPYQSEIASRMRPLRDFFLVIFFIILGSTIAFTAAKAVILTSIVLSLFILIGNPIILYILYRWVGFTRRNSILAGLTAAQVSEFGFVLLFTGERMGYVSHEVLVAFTMTAIATFVVSTYLVTYGDHVVRFLRPFLARFGNDRRQPEARKEQYATWLFGYHRMGWKVAEAIAVDGTSLAVVDDNPDAIAKIRQRGLKEFFGDASDEEFLDALPIAGARLVVSTIPDVDTSLVLVRALRHRLGTRARIVCTASHARDLPDLYAAGADYVILPHLLAGVWVSELLGTKRSPSPATFTKLRVAQTEALLLHAASAV